MGGVCSMHVTRLRNVLVEIIEEKRPLERFRNRWEENNIKRALE
jgi:hypothetical protein